MMPAITNTYYDIKRAVPISFLFIYLKIIKLLLFKTFYNLDLLLTETGFPYNPN